ncbi:MAG TPA: PilZ domain-containing protein [Terriglobales bacterium]|nr:PilZ domain-containing protein [Terriglobales bacterium]
MESKNQPEPPSSPIFSENRRHPRFSFQIDIGVYSRKTGLLKGHTVDISESGISAILTLEVSIGDLVQLEFTLPSGPVAIRALVRYKTAFRYGFQFVEPDTKGVIKAFCQRLVAEQGPA